ncbi:unnamed protein product [Rotaria magnacalcarata]|uniref:TLDc domain-containing protein n=1 Tax=Rotaria magnacalcarata TaxID=392030 RepID=A0A819QE77_9BILA|nr:unnamed protein product [Rotaria magnacalcarata]
MDFIQRLVQMNCIELVSYIQKSKLVSIFLFVLDCLNGFPPNDSSNGFHEIHYLSGSRRMVRYVMAASYNFQQFHSNSENQEIIDLQNNLASFEKRLDELQKCTSASNAAVKVLTLQEDVISLQHQIDNAAKSGKQEVKYLQKNFQDLKTSFTETAKTLSKRVDIIDDNLQDNTNRDNIHLCITHLDKHRCQAAAVIADKMAIDSVAQLIKDYYSSDDKGKEGRKKDLFEFINSSMQHLQVEKQLFVGGTLLSNKQYQLQLNEFYGNPNQEWKLVYKAIEHGFRAADFHEHCDGQAPTMIIIQSGEGNYLFGAFTQLLWSHTRGFRQDVNAFLFTLTNPHNLPPTKFAINRSKSDNAVYHSGAGYLGEYYYFYLFGFGGDGLHMFNFMEGNDGTSGTRRGDLFIASRCNKNSYSSIRFPCSFIDTCGYGDKTFTGTKYFTVKDIEAYTLK